jgi:hypothetical protein
MIRKPPKLRALTGLLAAVGLVTGLAVAYAGPAGAAASAPSSPAAGSSAVSLLHVQGATPSPSPVVVASPDITSKDAWCDGGTTVECINLTGGVCADGTVVQSYHKETSDTYEQLTFQSFGSLYEIRFSHCGTMYCIYTNTDHDLYLYTCDGSDTLDLYSYISDGGSAYSFGSQYLSGYQILAWNEETTMEVHPPDLGNTTWYAYTDAG